MKPIKVVMSAFGSYAGVESVSFEAFNHGIFLITGDTGAGKTTIFDAITYALYDETSGGKREGSMMRSHFAADETETFVELTFLYQGEIYKIRRSPSYESISKRKNKSGELTMVTKTPTVELTMPDGRLFEGKVRETNKQIVDIIGLDVNQFTQIAMIAQGDFLKLLHASSKERKEIFGKIFDTKIYGRLQEKLKEKARSLDMDLSRNKNACISEMDRISVMEGSEQGPLWLEIKGFSEVSPDKVLPTIAQIIQETREKEAQLTQQMAIAQIEIDGVKSQIQRAESINLLFDKLEQTNNTYLQLESQKATYSQVQSDILQAKKALKVAQKENQYLKKDQELKATFQRIEKIETELNNLAQSLLAATQSKEQAEVSLRGLSQQLQPEIIRIQDSLELYQEWALKAKKAEDSQQNVRVFEKHLKTITEALEVNKATTDKLNHEQTLYKDAKELFQKYEHEVQILNEKMKALIGMKTARERFDQLQIELVSAQKTLQESLLISQQKNAHYEQLNADFIAEQVGIIAEKLESGSACPVCGSTHHPHKAALSEKAVTQVAVDQAKNERHQAEDTLQKAKDRHMDLKSQCEQEVSFILREGKRVIGEDFEAHDQIEVAGRACKVELKEWMAKRDIEKANSSIFERNALALVELVKSGETLTSQKEEALIKLNEISTLNANLLQEVALLKKNLPYETRNAAQAALDQLKQKLTQAEQAFNVASDNYQNILKKREATQGALEAEKTAKDRQTIEVTEAKTHYLEEILIQGFVDALGVADEERYRHSLLTEDLIDQKEAAYKAYHENVLKVSENLRSYQEQTSGHVRIDLTNQKALEAQLLEQVNSYQRLSKVLYTLLDTNEKAETALKNLFEQRKKLKTSFEVISKLDKTANGNLSGVAKLDFQTYIQRRFFEHIIHEANKRLYVMSSEQFVLKCRDFKDLGSQGEVGLDLDVYSMVNDKTRDVKTLSGGESFMASLSMALGMADVIQNTAGKIHLDTMFIDEGFGSLDDDTREQAIGILNGLAEGKRLVGIISHVTELKERISQKLLVSKDEKGSKIRWEQA